MQVSCIFGPTRRLVAQHARSSLLPMAMAQPRKRPSPTTDPGAELRASGLRVTAVRTRVLSVLRAAREPLTHARLAAMPVLRDTNAITLYRTLTTLQEAGLLHAIHGVDGAWRYGVHAGEGHGCPGNHVHLMCERCGRVACLLDQGMPRVTAPRGWTVDRRQFLSIGTCATCARAPGR